VKKEKSSTDDELVLYDELPLWSAPFGMILLDTVRMRKGINILDIGSGWGFPMIELAERFGSSCQVTGIDPSADSVRMITRKIKRKGIPNARIFSVRAEEMPFPDGFFGLVVANNGLNNVGDVGRTLRECFRVLDAGGQLVATVNLPHTFVEFYAVFESALRELGLDEEIRRMRDHIDEKRKPVEYWKERIEEAGFDIRSIRPDGFRIRCSDGSAFLRHSFIRRAFLGPWESVVPEALKIQVFSLIEERLNQEAASSGSLEMSVPLACFDCEKG
jgi:ubiquinone/menaquinone biosynthesis C-methylase UbiE